MGTTVDSPITLKLETTTGPAPIRLATIQPEPGYTEEMYHNYHNIVMTNQELPKEVPPPGPALDMLSGSNMAMAEMEECAAPSPMASRSMSPMAAMGPPPPMAMARSAAAPSRRMEKEERAPQKKSKSASSSLRKSAAKMDEDCDDEAAGDSKVTL